MRAELFGDRAILVVDYPRPYEVRAAIADAFPDAHVRLGMDSLLVEYAEPQRDLREESERLLAEIDGAVRTSTPTKDLEVGVCYDGADLGTAASLLGINESELIRRHQNTSWRVALIGFAPGFPYLVPEADETVSWDLPRLNSPRRQVPAGSVAIAAGMSAIYPQASPGGWHLIGSTTERLFDPDRRRPALLAVGDRVQFREVR